MAIRLKSTLFAATVMSWLLLNLLSSAALANESSSLIHLSIPSQADDPVVLILSQKEVDENQIAYSEQLHVYVDNGKDCCDNRSPITGNYEADKKTVTFTPRFGFVAGQDYVISVRQKNKNNLLVHKLTKFSIQPNTPVVKPQVTGIYPSGDTLPENTLRFYIHFSTPMKPHMASEYIKLVDASGNIDDAAFMKFKQELWSEDRKRLTLLMDPGRIKRGVETNLALGPALLEGKQYQLRVDEGWPTANGKEFLSSFSKLFLVSNSLRELPNTEKWTITAPVIGTQDTLKIKFDRPFDHQLLYKDIKVFSVSGEVLQGSVIIANHEAEWHFLPQDAWVDERIYILVDSEFEDVAGNNFKDLLDHAIEDGTKKLSHISIPVDLSL